MATKTSNLKENERRSGTNAETQWKITNMRKAIQRSRLLIDVMKVNRKPLNICGIEMTNRILGASQSIFLPSIFLQLFRKLGNSKYNILLLQTINSGKIGHKSAADS